MRRYIRVNNKILIIIVTVIIFSLAAGVVLSLEEQTAFALQVKKIFS